jgi:hypothetical protein
MAQLGINPEMDKLARENGLGHWSCVSPLDDSMWVRSDGATFSNGVFTNTKRTHSSFHAGIGIVWIEVLKGLDGRFRIGEDWQKPETEEDFLNRKLPCDLKIGCGTNKAGTTIKTLVMRANNIIEMTRRGSPTLIQKPFQYPCDGARYFTRKEGYQIGCFYRRGDTIEGGNQLVRTNAELTTGGFFGNWDIKTGVYVGDGDGNPDYDLIMFVWE